MTERQKKFVEHYLTSLNATEAAKHAGYSDRTAHVQGCRLLNNAKVQRSIDAHMKKRSEKMGIRAERVLEVLEHQLEYDPRKFFAEDGSPVPLKDLGEREAMAIAGFEVLEQYAGTGRDRVFIGHLKKYKLACKSAAVDKAMRHLSLYRDKLEVSGKVTLEELVAGSMEPKK